MKINIKFYSSWMASRNFWVLMSDIVHFIYHGTLNNATTSMYFLWKFRAFSATFHVSFDMRSVFLKLFQYESHLISNLVIEPKPWWPKFGVSTVFFIRLPNYFSKNPNAHESMIFEFEIWFTSKVIILGKNTQLYICS